MFDEKIEVFLRSRQIPLFSRIEGTTQAIITKAICYLNAQSNSLPIRLLIDCTGGQEWSGRMIGDIIRNSEAPVHGLVVGDAQSAAFRVLQHCHHRSAYPNARLMFHAATLERSIIETTAQRNQVQALVRSHEDMLLLIQERSGQPMEKIRRWCKREHKFTGVEALKLNFVDEVVNKT